jgi:hypothetical protein
MSVRNSRGRAPQRQLGAYCAAYNVPAWQGTGVMPSMP